MSDMMYTAEERLSDLCTDVFVAAHLARDRRLRPDYADALAMRVRSASRDMIEDGDRELLSKTANLLERVSVRVKSVEARPVRPRAKVAPPQPDIKAMIRAADAEQLARTGPFDRDTSEALELQRVREQNRQLAERNRQLEAERARQVNR